MEALKIKPSEMPKLRDRMLKRLPTLLPDTLQHAILTETPTGFPDDIARVPDVRKMRHQPGLLSAVLEQETTKYTTWLLRQMRAADLFMVTKEQTERALAAGLELPGFYLRPEDLPSPIGLMLFGDHIYNQEDQPTSVVAIMWGPGQTHGKSGLWITTWGDSTTIVNHPQWLDGEATDYHRRAGLEAMGPLYYHDEGLVPWQPEWRETTMPHEALRTTFATWVMMKQKITSERVVKPSASAAKKKQYRDRPVSPVRVIDVRQRVVSPGEKPEREKVDLEYRTPIGRFWRLYHTGPGRSIPKLLRIEEHYRGPEDAPIRPRRETVKVLK